jgi:hypothetical protein
MQSKFTSPLLGYNNNVRHKSRVFHIQTEDSGVKHPHIITHLFMDGGRILKSVKKSYAEHVGVDGMTDIVKTMMKEQHKAMFIALRDGQFDHLVDPPAAAVAPAKEAAPASAAAVPAANLASTTEAAAASVASPAAPAVAPPPVAPGPPSSAAPGPASVTAPSAPTSAAAVAPERGAPASNVASRAAVSSSVASQPVPTDASPPMSDSDEEPAASDGATLSAASPSPGPSLTLDIDALERAAKDAEGGSPVFPSHSDLPPPPENLFRDRPAASGYRGQPGIEERPRTRPPTTTPSARQPPAPAAGRPAPAPASSVGVGGAGAGAGAGPARPRSPSDPPRRVPPPVPASDARYAPTRPASIFGASRPPPATSTSIFGGDLMSDKSLDEVILSYLAEDLELEGKKK